MKFGWNPASKHLSVPIKFDHDYSEWLEEEKKGIYQLVFKNHNFENSTFINNLINHIPFKYDGMVPEFTNTVEFNANFESANLDRVYFWGGYEFDIFMRNDPNTKGHN